MTTSARDTRLVALPPRCRAAAGLGLGPVPVGCPLELVRPRPRPPAAGPPAEPAWRELCLLCLRVYVCASVFCFFGCVISNFF